MVVGCKHKEQEIKTKWDEEYGEFYCYICCPICDYYWEGYTNNIIDNLHQKDNT